MKRILISRLFAVLFLFAAAPTCGFAAEEDDSNITAVQQKLYDQFEKRMTGVRMVGRFTILGREQGNLPKEEYEIKSVRKLPDGDVWLFNARVKYGKNDRTLPMPLEVKWAGDTPVITLTKFTIPGMGSFSARVVIYNDKYAGTWTHHNVGNKGQVGGHLFGELKAAGKKEAEEN